MINSLFLCQKTKTTMRPVMNKERFAVLHSRQQQSGLSIKDFCINESYCVATFYYWRKKFAIATQPLKSSVSVPKVLTPIRFPATVHSATIGNNSVPAADISIDLPNGLKVHFRGSEATEPAILFITQLSKHHVLSQ